MAAGPLGKAIREKEARRLLKEVGGAGDTLLIAARGQRVGLYRNESDGRVELSVGNTSRSQHTRSITVVRNAAPNAEPEQIVEPFIYRLTDGRIPDFSYGSVCLYESAEEYRQLLAAMELSIVEEADRRKHPLGARFPNGRGFIDAVAQLARELPGKLLIEPDVLNGSVDSLEYVDKAVRRLGGQKCFGDRTILASVVAYVGEVMREASDGRWENRGEGSERWEPVIVGANGREYHPFGIFKALLESSSVWARVEVDLGEFGSLGSRARRRQEIQRPATGTLGTVPADAYQVTLRYGDGRPRTVRFNRDIRVAGFPCRAGTEAGFSRSGEMFAATLSEPHSFGKLRFGPGTWVGYLKGQQDGRVHHVTLGEDQEVDGLPCSAGTYVSFHPNQRVCGASLATDHEVGGIPCASGREVSFHKNGRLSVATLAEEHVLAGRRFPRGTWLLFDARGRLVRASLAEDWEIDSIPAKAGEFVEFYENGRMQWVTLARSHSVLGQTYPDGTRLYFDKDGRLTYAQPGFTSTSGSAR